MVLRSLQNAKAWPFHFSSLFLLHFNMSHQIDSNAVKTYLMWLIFVYGLLRNYELDQLPLNLKTESNPKKLQSRLISALGITVIYFRINYEQLDDAKAAIVILFY